MFTFVQPKKGFVSMPARCVQQHRLSVHPGGVLSLVTDMQPSDIPCADCFRVQSYWIVSGRFTCMEALEGKRWICC